MNGLNREDEQRAKSALQTVQMAESWREAADALGEAGYDKKEAHRILTFSVFLMKSIHHANRAE